MRHLDGFVSANIHRSVDGHRVVNYAQWKSVGAFNAMRENAEAAPHMERVAELADAFDPIVCTVADAISSTVPDGVEQLYRRLLQVGTTATLWARRTLRRRRQPRRSRRILRRLEAGDHGTSPLDLRRPSTGPLRRQGPPRSSTRSRRRAAARRQRSGVVGYECTRVRVDQRGEQQRSGRHLAPSSWTEPGQCRPRPRPRDTCRHARHRRTRYGCTALRPRAPASRSIRTLARSTRRTTRCRVVVAVRPLGGDRRDGSHRRRTRPTGTPRRAAPRTRARRSRSAHAAGSGEPLPARSGATEASREVLPPSSRWRELGRRGAACQVTA